MTDRNPGPLQEVVKSWGYAPFSYWALAASQFFVGTYLPGASGLLLGVLGFFSIVLGFAHKGLSFDEARLRSRGGLMKFPWSQKTTHMIVCVATMLICSQMIRSEDESTCVAGILGTVCAALGGWLGSLVNGPSKI